MSYQLPNWSIWFIYLINPLIRNYVKINGWLKKKLNKMNKLGSEWVGEENKRPFVRVTPRYISDDILFILRENRHEFEKTGLIRTYSHSFYFDAQRRLLLYRLVICLIKKETRLNLDLCARAETASQPFLLPPTLSFSFTASLLKNKQTDRPTGSETLTEEKLARDRRRLHFSFTVCTDSAVMSMQERPWRCRQRQDVFVV